MSFAGFRRTEGQLAHLNVNGLFSGLPRGKYEFAGLAHHPAGDVPITECYMGFLALVFRS